MSEEKRGENFADSPAQKTSTNDYNLEYAKTKLFQQKFLFRLMIGLVGLAVIGFAIYLCCVVSHPDPTHGQLIILGMFFS